MYSAFHDYCQENCPFRYHAYALTTPTPRCPRRFASYRGLCFTYASVVVKFELPGMHGDVVARGYVISDEAAGIFRRAGIRFTMLPPEQQSRICGYCQRVADDGSALETSVSMQVA